MTTRRFHDSDDHDLNLLYFDFAEADVQPLWLQEGLLPASPTTLQPHVWRYKDLKQLAERSGDLVDIDRGGDRRVLALAHPNLEGKPFATRTMWAAVQYLNGGEVAPAHRHTPAALRFIMEGSGVWTLVDGDPLSMQPGDLILTPKWAWHEHHNPGTEPMIWFDGLDLPLIQTLDAVFYEDGPDEPTPHQQQHRSASEHAYAAPGVVPANDPPPVDHSPLLAYRWKDTDRALSNQLTSNPVDHASVRFVDPTSGRDALPTLRCEMHRFVPGPRTPIVRKAGSSIWVVFRGAGKSRIGDASFTWSAGDIFVVPSWVELSHQVSESSDVFVMSDAPMLEAFGLRRSAKTEP